LNFITTQLKNKLSADHKLFFYNIIDPQNIDEAIKKIKNNTKITIYDLTITKTKKNLATIPVNDHINKTGQNPLIKKQNVLNIDFLDIGGSYKKKQGGVITNCCGETLQLQYLYPSHYLCNITILAKALKIQECHAYLINIL
tara:strand:- start:2261 stop:2686 length:426 start_codon:yes stop_codon:yes gene_type:complete